jgi:hypothetical protein
MLNQKSYMVFTVQSFKNTRTLTHARINAHIHVTKQKHVISITLQLINRIVIIHKTWVRSVFLA